MKVSLLSLMIKNILSFENSFIEFDKLTVVIGPNASGKSNLIKVLNLLKYISHGKSINEILNGIFGYENINEFLYHPKEDCRIIASFKINNDIILYNLEFDFYGSIILEQIQYKSGKDVIKREGKSISSYIFGLTFGDDKIEADLIRDYLQKICAYSFISENIRSDHQIMEDVLLIYDGTNVAAVLHNLLVNDRDRFFRIEDKLKRIFPFIKKLNITTRVINYPRPMVSINIDENEPNKKLYRNNISDGTLRIIAFLTALELDSSLIIFEEPENCIHMSLFDTLIDVFKKSPNQIILTTHSPYLLSKVEINQVRLLEKQEGATIIKPITNVKEVQELIAEGIPLGEIWYMGRLEE